MGAYKMAEHCNDFLAGLEVLHFRSDLHDLSSHIGRCYQNRVPSEESNKQGCFQQKVKQTTGTMRITSEWPNRRIAETAGMKYMQKQQYLASLGLQYVGHTIQDCRNLSDREDRDRFRTHVLGICPAKKRTHWICSNEFSTGYMREFARQYRSGHALLYFRIHGVQANCFNPEQDFILLWCRNWHFHMLQEIQILEPINRHRESDRPTTRNDKIGADYRYLGKILPGRMKCIHHKMIWPNRIYDPEWSPSFHWRATLWVLQNDLWIRIIDLQTLCSLITRCNLSTLVSTCPD